MPYYRVTIEQSGGGLDYGVPDTQQIQSPRYRWPDMECAFFYPEALDDPRLTELTEAQWQDFDARSLDADDGQVTADGADTEQLVATYPVTDGEVLLYVNDAEVAREVLDANGQATFNVTAASSLAGTLLKCESEYHNPDAAGDGGWGRETVYVEAVA